MSHPPIVSIGVPVFNGENYLRQALASIQSQSYENLEILISDNASIDATQTICQEYASRDSRIVYFRQLENIGSAGNFNFVFEKAHGKYFKWASHDDVFDPTYVERCVDVLEARPDIVWCHCDSDLIDEFGVSWKDRLPADDEEIEFDVTGQRRWKGLPRVDFDSPQPHRRFAGVLLGTRWCVDCYGLIRSDALCKTALLTSVYGSEKVLMGELALMGPTYQIPELLFKQRVHKEASSYQSDVQSQDTFVHARNAKPFASTRLALIVAHQEAVRRSDVRGIERIRCYIVVGRYLCQFRKWGRVIRSTLLRQGVGGGGKRILEAGSV